MAPHRALETIDILIEIFEHMAPADASPEMMQRSRETLASVARVCTTFLDPALSVLWRILDDLIPLLSLFPSFGAIRVPESERKSAYSFHAFTHVFCGAICKGDWTRFQKYAGHVRVITNAGTCNIDSTVFSNISRFSSSRPLVPALKELHGDINIIYRSPHHHDTDDFEVMSVMSPSVLRLHLKLRDTTGRTQPPFPTDDVPQVLLCKISPLVPHLRDLQISCHGIGTRLPTSRVLSKSSMVNLRELCKVDVSRCRSTSTSDLLCHLSTLDSLVHLAVEVGAQNAGDGSLTGGFHALQDLAARGPLSGITQLIEAVESQDLRSLKIYQKHGDSARGVMEAWCNVIDIISLNFHASLREIHVSTAYHKFWEEGEDEDEMVENVLRIVRPLFVVEELQSLVLAWSIEHIPLALEDDDIFQIASAWPKLQELEFLFPLRVAPPLNSLIHLARLCPDLKKLALPRLRSSHRPALEMFPIMAHKLRFANLGVPEDPVFMAQIVDRLFPSLEVVDPGPVPLRGWARVIPPLLELQAGRRAIT